MWVQVVSTIEDALPPPDVEPTLKNCQKMVKIDKVS
jgi:hypothetical protein